MIIENKKKIRNRIIKKLDFKNKTLNFSKVEQSENLYLFLKVFEEDQTCSWLIIFV